MQNAILLTLRTGQTKSIWEVPALGIKLSKINKNASNFKASNGLRQLEFNGAFNII